MDWASTAQTSTLVTLTLELVLPAYLKPKVESTFPVIKNPKDSNHQIYKPIIGTSSVYFKEATEAPWGFMDCLGREGLDLSWFWVCTLLLSCDNSFHYCPLVPLVLVLGAKWFDSDDMYTHYKHARGFANK